VNQVDELRGEPHLESRGLFVEGSHPHAGPFTYLRESGVVADDAYVVRHPAPLLGEHTDEILAELGYEHDSVEELRSLDVV
jgi:crotonobetainyl-CoA:carnitine CoA-transferase CaiB-like acyl-CoA transferase